MTTHVKQLAILGCAHPRTRALAEAIAEREDVKLKSIWDHDDARGQSLADDAEARFFGAYDTIFRDPEIDAVIVLAEAEHHDELRRAAREHGTTAFFGETSDAQLANVDAFLAGLEQRKAR